MIALDEKFPFVPEVHIFHSRAKADRYIRKHIDTIPRFLDAGAQTWSNDSVAVVLMEYEGEATTEAALLVHEAYHVVSYHFGEYLGDEHPSEELMAYGIQMVSKALFEAHDKWKMKKVSDG